MKWIIKANEQRKGELKRTNQPPKAPLPAWEWAQEDGYLRAMMSGKLSAHYLSREIVDHAKHVGPLFFSISPKNVSVINNIVVIKHLSHVLI